MDNQNTRCRSGSSSHLSAKVPVTVAAAGQPAPGAITTEVSRLDMAISSLLAAITEHHDRLNPLLNADDPAGTRLDETPAHSCPVAETIRQSADKVYIARDMLAQLTARIAL